MYDFSSYMNFTTQCVFTSTCSADKGHITIDVIRNGIEVDQESRWHSVSSEHHDFTLLQKIHA